MQLCEHLSEVYRNELSLGNEVLAVGTGYSTGYHICVFFKRPIQSKSIPEGLETETSVLHWYPREYMVQCKKCMMLLGFPLEENQPDNYAPSSSAKPDPRVICTAQTVFFPEDYHETGILPTMK